MKLPRFKYLWSMRTTRVRPEENGKVEVNGGGAPNPNRKNSRVEKKEKRHIAAKKGQGEKGGIYNGFTRGNVFAKKLFSLSRRERKENLQQELAEGKGEDSKPKRSTFIYGVGVPLKGGGGEL